MLWKIILVLFYFITPALLIHYAGKYLLLRKAGTVLLAYIVGLIVGNIGIIPDEAYGLQDMIMSLTLPLALPLLLMSLNLSNWENLAKNTLWSLVTGVVAVIIVVIISHLIFKHYEKEQWKISGMLIGVYTGGTPNLASIKTALNIPSETYILTHSSDLVVSAVYLLFLMTLGRTIFRKYLPYGYNYLGRFQENTVLTNFEDYSDFFKKYNLIPTLKGFGVSVLIFAIGGGMMMVVPPKLQMVTVILIITTLGIASSFVNELRRGPKNFELGMYFILVFSLVVASMADFSKFTAEAIPIFLNVSFVVFFALIVHVALARIFKIDADTVMITSTALICSPPFVPLIAGALNNRQIILSGLTVGLIGYAVGNYLGIVVAYFLRFYF